MKALNAWALIAAILIAAGEVARFGGSMRFVPMAFDELIVGAALAFAAWRSRRDGAVWHVAAWGAFCGLTLVLLVETLDHHWHGAAKPNAAAYLTALGAMLVLGLWAVGRALRLVLTRR